MKATTKIRLMKIGIPVLLGAVVLVGVVRTLGANAADAIYHAGVLEAAEQSYEKRLYQEAILNYKEALATGSGVEVYQRMHEIYRDYYAEEHTAAVRASYLNDMTDAYNAFPEYVEFWEESLALYQENQDYESAFTLCKDALGRGVQSEAISMAYRELRLVTDVDFTTFDEVRTALGGVVVARTSDGIGMVNGAGEIYNGYYLVAGTPNPGGLAMYQGAYDPRLIDVGGVTRARFDVGNIVDAGVYDYVSHKLAVRLDGDAPVPFAGDAGDDEADSELAGTTEAEETTTIAEEDEGPQPPDINLTNGSNILVGNAEEAAGAWHYLDAVTHEMGDAAYDVAGTYTDGLAAVKMNGAWYLVDTEGGVRSLSFEEIRLDSFGRYVQNGSGVVFAKSDGQWGMYDAAMNRINDFTCDDIDVYVDGPVAFERDGQWGFVTLDGTVVCEPTFAGARSFCLGNAAACNVAHHWGFVDGNFAPSTQFIYYDAFYFTAAGTALVCDGKDSYKFMTYQYV